MRWLSYGERRALSQSDDFVHNCHVGNAKYRYFKRSNVNVKRERRCTEETSREQVVRKALLIHDVWPVVDHLTCMFKLACGGVRFVLSFVWTLLFRYDKTPPGGSTNAMQFLCELRAASFAAVSAAAAVIHVSYCCLYPSSHFRYWIFTFSIDLHVCKCIISNRRRKFACSLFRMGAVYTKERERNK